MPDRLLIPLANPCRRYIQHLLLLTAYILIFTTPALAINDLMLLPAVKSDRAAGSLFLDVTRAGDRLVAVGERGHVLLSDDNGSHWRQASVPVSVTLTAVQFPTEKMGWIVGHDGVVLHSQDGGESWTMQFEGNAANQLMVGYAEQQLAAKEAEFNQQTVELSEDQEIELEDLRYALDDARFAVDEGGWKPLLDLLFLNDKIGFIVGAYASFFRTEDGGASWQPWNEHIYNPDKFHFSAISSSHDGQQLYIAGEAGTLYRSTDKGLSWESLVSPYEGSFFDIVSDQRSSQVVAMGLRGSAFRSEDEGASWQRIETSVDTPLSGGIFLSDGQLVIASHGLLIGDAATLAMNTAKVRPSSYSAVTQSADGQIILVGLMGVKRVSANGQEGEDK